MSIETPTNTFEDLLDDPILLTSEPDDLDPIERSPRFDSAQLEQLAEYWVEQYGGTGKTFSADQEQLIAADIQVGLDAESRLAEGGSATPDMIEFIVAGQRAQQALVETNLRFTLMFARESVGIKQEKARARFIEAQQANADTSTAPRAKRTQRHLGTYRPLSSLVSPRANLEDRYTMAAEGLLDAARKFKPGGNAKFVTYAAWRVQAKLDRGVLESEHRGARFPDNIQDKLSSYFAEYPSVDATHVVPPEIDDLFRSTDHRDYPETYGAVTPGSVEDLADEWSEDDKASSLADVWDDPNSNVASEAELLSAANSIETVLRSLNERGELSEREELIIKLRYGLGKCACHDLYDTPHNFEEIGMVVGVTRERIRQLEAKAISKLRKPSVVRDFRGLYQSFLEQGISTAETVWRGDAVQLPEVGSTHVADTEYPQILSSAPPTLTEEEFLVWQERQAQRFRQENRASWQVDADEAWDSPVRELPRPLEDSELENYVQLLNDAPAFIFSKKFSNKADSTYPAYILEQFRERQGKAYFNGKQITELWNSFIGTRYKELRDELETDFDADKVGHLFSRLIAENISDNDEIVEFEIPEFASGQIGFLASNLGIGKVEIIGDAGTHVGAWNHGYAEVTVHGNAHDNAGALMNGNARLKINGEASHGFGLGAKGEAELTAGAVRSVGSNSAVVSIGNN